MSSKTALLFALLALPALAGCTPLVVGAGAAVVADEVIEQEKGGDGLF